MIDVPNGWLEHWLIGRTCELLERSLMQLLLPSNDNNKQYILINVWLGWTLQILYVGISENKI